MSAGGGDIKHAFRVSILNSTTSSLRFGKLSLLGPLRFMLLGALALLLGHQVRAERQEKPATTLVAPSSSTTVQGIAWRDARMFAEVLEHVRREYVETRSDQELIEAAIRGMIADLDPYSAYLDAWQFEEIKIDTSGEYFGVGIEVALEDGVVRIVALIEDTPAARAGLKVGDVVLAVDGITVQSDDLSDTIDRMRGHAGTKVRITVARSSLDGPLQFTLARASVHVRSVSGELLEPDLGYVKISHFSETTAADLEQEIYKLKKSNGRPLLGLALDLRDNPGGVLEAAVSVADLFLESGLIVSAAGRAVESRFKAQAHPGDVLEGAPIIVLVNAGSASASEIVAGALKDHGRARLVGSRTYGKGSVQTVMPLSGGSAIKLTTSRYFTPSGASIHERGILPDVFVDPGDVGRGLENAEDTAGAAGIAVGTADGTGPAIRPASGAIVIAGSDRELQVALPLLRKSRPPAIPGIRSKEAARSFESR